VYYCSPECQRADWKGHKPACKVATAEREASQLVRVGKGGGSAPPAAAPERVGPPASQYVAGAARGDADALFRLGLCYYYGEDVWKKMAWKAPLNSPPSSLSIDTMGSSASRMSASMSLNAAAQTDAVLFLTTACRPCARSAQS